MEPIIISEESISKSRRNSSNSGFCCCRNRYNSSTISINTQFNNNQYEYVVEKLIIKRVPVKVAVDARSASCNNNMMDNINTSMKHEPKPIIFDSYCQLSPKKYTNDPQKLLNKSITAFNENHEYEHGDNLLLPELPSIEIPTFNTNISAKFTTKPARTLPLGKKDVAPIHYVHDVSSVHKNQTDREKNELHPNFSKPRSVTSLKIDPSIKNTLDMLARKKASDDSHPECRTARESVRDIPLKLEDVYQDNEPNTSMMRQRTIQDEKHRNGKFLLEKITSDLHSTNKEVKWKIVIKQKKDKLFPSAHRFSSNLDYFSDSLSE